MDSLSLSGLKQKTFLSAPKSGLNIDENREALEKEKKIKQTCADFESILIYSMFKAMRKTVSHSGFLEKMPGSDTYTMLFDQQVANELAKRNAGTGLQQIIYEQLKQHR